MKSKSIDLIALSESRWPGNGISTICGTTVLHSKQCLAQESFCRLFTNLILHNTCSVHTICFLDTRQNIQKEDYEFSKEVNQEHRHFTMAALQHPDNWSSA